MRHNISNARHQVIVYLEHRITPSTKIDLHLQLAESTSYLHTKMYWINVAVLG